MDAATFATLALACAPLVDPATAHALVSVESSLNPYAIGVVAGALERQPRTGAEALATSRRLAAQGWSYSVGLAQINDRNFKRLGLTPESAFDPCINLTAMQSILTECYGREVRRGATDQVSLRRALSCYYSGNPHTGFTHGYVQRIARSAARLSAFTTKESS